MKQRIHLKGAPKSATKLCEAWLLRGHFDLKMHEELIVKNKHGIYEATTRDFDRLFITWKDPLPWAVSAWRFWLVYYSGVGFGWRAAEPNESFASFIRTQRPLKLWSKLNRMWLDTALDRLVVRYQNVLLDPHAEVNRVARWLGLEAGVHLDLPGEPQSAPRLPSFRPHVNAQPFPAERYYGHHYPKQPRGQKVRFDPAYYLEEQWRDEYGPGDEDHLLRDLDVETYCELQQASMTRAPRGPVAHIVQRPRSETSTNY